MSLLGPGDESVYIGKPRRPVCPICHHYLSEWEINAGKTSMMEAVRVHTSCLQDYKLKYGKEWSLADIVRLLGGG